MNIEILDQKIIRLTEKAMGAKLKDEYEKDFYAWTLHNAELMRQGKLSEIDVENIAEEIESMGKSDKRELINRLAVLIAHLLKWQFQSNRRSRSWEDTLLEQRTRVRLLLSDSPSLKHELNLRLDTAYELSIFTAMKETKLSKNTFPKKCPYTLDQCLNPDFFPSPAD